MILVAIRRSHFLMASLMTSFPLHSFASGLRRLIGFSAADKMNQPKPDQQYKGRFIERTLWSEEVREVSHLG